MPLFERAERLPFFLDACQITDLQNKQILDYGGNAGNILVDGLDYYNLQQSQYTCLDVDNDALNQGSKLYPHANWIKHNAFSPAYHQQGQHNCKFPFPDQTFDYIFGYSIHSHTTLEALLFDLTEMYRVCKPNGIIATTVVDADFCQHLWAKRVRDYGSAIDYKEIAATQTYNYFINNNVLTQTSRTNVDIKFFISIYNLNWLCSKLESLNYNVKIAKDYAPFHQPMVIINK
jgi:ubiquinone/menaquinone biosynthesis C-methylase UbiE